MADKLRELPRQIEDLFESNSQPVSVMPAGEPAPNVFPEVDRLSGGKRRRIRFKSVDEQDLEEVLRKISSILRCELSDLSAFQNLTDRISERALDTDQEKMKDIFTKDRLFILPLVDEECKVMGRSVFYLRPMSKFKNTFENRYMILRPKGGHS
jgi:hypothetical protein